MRIAVTGASGNLGTAVVRRLLGAGHDVVGLVRRPPTDPTGELAQVDWVAVDLSRDDGEPVLQSAVAHADVVVHLAWAFQPSHRPEQLEATGVGGTGRVLRAVAAGGVGRLVHLSSVGAYSPKRDDRPVDESYPTGGIASSPYSRHKSTAERMLDDFERQHPDVTVTRMRPGIIGRREAGSALLRYGLPALAPAALLRVLPLLPVDRSLLVPFVHADDVAAAVGVAAEADVPGAFNLAAEPVVTVEHLAAVLGARHVHVPMPVVRAAVSGGWHARVIPLDPGWIDLAAQVPVMDCSRAAAELGWTPTTDAVATLQEMVDGMRDRSSLPTPALRPRTGGDLLRRLVREGPVSRRRRS